MRLFRRLPSTSDDMCCVRGIIVMPASKRSRAIAERQDRNVTSIASKAVDPLGSMGVQIRTAVLRAVRRGGSTKSIINRELRDFVPLMAQAMTAAYIMGQYQSKRLAKSELVRGDEVVDVLGRWTKIVGFAEKRAGMSKEALGTLFDGFEGQAVQAMKSMGGVLEAQVRAAVAEATRQGLHYRGTEELVRKAFDAAGMTNAKPWLIETQARTQTQLAYSAGMYAAEQDEAIQEIIWGREYVTVGDDRVRPNHAALDGLRLPIDHPRWKEILPPNGWNCRCSTVPIYKGDDIATTKNVPKYVTVDGERVEAGPDEGFDFDPIGIARELGV